MTDRIIRPNAGHILLPRRFVDVGMPLPKVGASGRYKLRKLKGGIYTGEETPWFDNIILDSGLNRWGSGTIILGAAIGTGTATPLATDTGLQAQAHYTTTTGTGHNVVSSAGSSPYNNTRTLVYRTTLGALNGTYTEVGAGWASGSMFSRALILDGGGSPTSISVASDEQLDIVYQLSVYPPLADTGPSIVTISGVDYTITGRAVDVNDTLYSGANDTCWGVSLSVPVLSSITGGSGIVTNGGLAAITASGPTGSTGAGGSPTMNAYSNGSYTRSGYYTFGLSNANVSGGITACYAPWGDFAAFQYGISPAIPKDSTKTLVLNFSVSWARRP